MRVAKIIAFSVLCLFAFIGVLFVAVFVAMQLGLLNVRGSIAERNRFFGANTPASAERVVCVEKEQKECAWNKTPEWVVIREGLTKDRAVIQEVSRKTGVSARLIAAVVVPEQVRFFTAEREVFKRYFEPLKILGSLSQFSLGVSGIKETTARQIEEYAASTTSPFYPGPGMKELIAYSATESESRNALYNRLTDPRNHYYSYLYTALFIKEIQAQWRAAGFATAQTPGAIVTLFNVGFAASHPNVSPQVAGSMIATGGHTYSYGELGALFYDSDELTDIFPK